MSFKSSITKRVRKRTNKAGEVVFHTRYVLNYKHPVDGKRHQEFFERRADVQDRQSQLAATIEIDPLFDPMGSGSLWTRKGSLICSSRWPRMTASPI